MLYYLLSMLVAFLLLSTGTRSLNDPMENWGDGGWALALLATVLSPVGILGGIAMLLENSGLSTFLLKERS